MAFFGQHAVRGVFLATLLAALWISAPPLGAQLPAPPPPPQEEPAAAEGESPEEAVADTQPKRLILKDGSYQPTIRWEERGDRIRYLSAERYQWEEIPRDLVDWEATDRYHRKVNPPSPTPEQKRAIEIEAAEAAAAAAEEERRRLAELDETNPQVAPGLRLPDDPGVYLVDVFRGEPQLVEIIQNGSEINADRGRNILRAAINPLAKSKHKIELEGISARIQSHIPDPAIYLNIDHETSDSTESSENLQQRFQIARMKVEKQKRVVGVIEFALYGNRAQKTDVVPAEVSRVGDDWVKVKPKERLSPGEYAVVEMVGKDVNLYVWDFGVDPRAAENPPKWEPPRPKEEKKDDGKSLLERILGRGGKN